MRRTGLQAWRVRCTDFPWTGTEGEKLQFLVNYAVLAPSKYNAQPWLFELCGNSVDLICDRAWAFRETDPQCRELVLSCGAALLNLAVAAHHFGCVTRVQPFPWLEDRYLLARVHLESASGEVAPPPSWLPAGPDLFEAIQHRATCRGRLGKRVPAEPVLAQLAAGAEGFGARVHWTTEPAGRAAIAKLVARGDCEQMANRTLRREMVRWLHYPLGRFLDGFPVSRYGVNGALAVLTPGISLGLRAFNLGKLVAARDAQLAGAAPVLGMLSTRNDEPADWLAAGQALELLFLQATAAGLSISFFNQPIEVPHLRGALGNQFGSGACPQVLLRLGYGRRTRHTPRRPAREVVI